MWRRTGRQRAVAGERRRGRRIGADVPTLTGPDFVLTSGAQVAPTVEPWPAGLGRRRSYGGPGPTKPVQPLTPPQRGASPLACTYPPPPRNPPPTKPSRSDRQRPREGGNPGWRRGVPSPRRAATPSTADEERRPPCPQVDADPALLEVMQRAPTGSNPPPRLSAEDTPWANRPSKGPRPQSIKGESSNSLGKGALARKQLLFYPPASFKNRQKTQSNLTKGD